ncbi:MAG TPA: hypothetical protein VKB57_23110 [Acidimicrobiales bacterium]|nr:hypothetical protein [Acidimicrobiales bacterium]
MTATDVAVAVEAPARAPAPERSLRARALVAVPAYLPVALIAAGGWVHRWTTEDAFINFRILDNLFAGDGPVFNAGERIEAGTSPLWLGLLAVGRVLFGWLAPIEWIAVVMGLVAAVAAFALAGRCARLAAPRPDTAVVAIGPLVVSSVAVVWDFATSGLEMSLAWLWIATCWYVLCRIARGDSPSAGKRALGAAVIGLGPLVRPDLGVMMLCFVVAWFLLTRPRRVVVDLGAIFLAPVLYQVFRMGYYASVVPSTALAKDAGGHHIRQGWRYLADFSGPYRLLFPAALILAAIAVRLWRDRDRGTVIATGAVLAAAGLHAAYILAAGGDYMHGRLLLPAFFALGLPAYVVLRGRVLPLLALSVLTGAWAAAAIVWFRPPVPPPGIPMVADWRQITGSGVMPDDFELVPTGMVAGEVYDRGLRGYLGPMQRRPDAGRDPDALVVALGAIGLPAYQLGTDVRVIDIGGLAEPLAAHTDPIPGRPAGHRKQVDLAWYTARFGIPDDDDVAAQDAARALGCGPVAGLLDSVSRPLTPGRFLSNMWHSVTYTRLRIPADPTKAADEFC